MGCPCPVRHYSFSRLLLTLLSFGASLLFCEIFRRYRNIFPLGLVHGALGLTIAACLPDTFLHHMRVGLGYLSFRPGLK